MASPAPNAFARPHPQGCQIMLKVVPGASRSKVVGVMADGVLKVAVAKPPSGGQANEAVLKLLAETLAVPPRSVELIGGASSPRKTVLVRGLEPAEVQRRVGASRK